MDRLGSRGDFLQRINQENMKAIHGRSYTKAQLDAMELDYKAMPDKLQCPLCEVNDFNPF